MGNRESRNGRDVAGLHQGLELLGRGALLVAESSPLLLEHWEQVEQQLQRMEAKVASLQHSVDRVEAHLGRVENELARLGNKDQHREMRMVALEKSIENALVRMFPRVDALLIQIEKNKDLKLMSKDKLVKSRQSSVDNSQSCSSNIFVQHQSCSDTDEARFVQKTECPIKGVSSFPLSPSQPGVSAPNSSSLYEEWGEGWVGELDNALLEAAKEGRSEDVQCLIASGANINTENVQQTTPLMLAAYEGYSDTLQVLLRAGADVECRDMNEYLPLHAAACRGHEGAVHVLVEAGVDINARDGVTGSTALILAASKGHAECVYRLLQNNKTNIESRDDDGMTALHRAVMYAKASSVALLLDAGADVNSVDQRGWSPIDYAFRSGTEEIQQVLSGRRRSDVENLEDLQLNFMDPQLKTYERIVPKILKVPDENESSEIQMYETEEEMKSYV
ncbi:hypothetical protein R5R35_011183 [Gryllus longicercus]|uniref:Ankyrin repeat domain-containing protein n=1 Tax=Gryllus longicercus TaxID=2509291 RepID=A0AAN9VSW3_9ORTH